jgi:hypothetical protein
VWIWVHVHGEVIILAGKPLWPMRLSHLAADCGILATLAKMSAVARSVDTMTSHPF